MITEFFDSWHLFQDAYLAGWLIVVLLSMVGILVVARDQIFIGAAVTEASTLGIALGMWLGSLPAFHDHPWLESETHLAILSVVFSILAALITARGGTARGSTEAVTGWVFLFAGSVAILVVAHSPHGLEEVHRLLLSSSIIGASGLEVVIFAALAVVIGGWIIAYRERILLVLLDEQTAEALGLRVRAWNLGISCLLGIVVGLSIGASGMLYTFGCLVLPALAARGFCRRARHVFIVAPAIGLVTTAAAFVLANGWDQPPGQMAVALLCVVAAVAAGVKRVRAGR